MGEVVLPAKRRKVRRLDQDVQIFGQVQKSSNNKVIEGEMGEKRAVS